MTSSAMDPFGRPAGAGPDSPEELAANRAGQITPGQKQRAWPRFLPTLISSVFGLIILGPLFGCFLPTFLGVFWETGAPDGASLLFMIPFSLVFLGIAGGAAWSAFGVARALLDLNAGRVEMADGRLAWQRREYRGLVDGRPLRLLRGDERLPGAYRFYYLPHSRYILSAERLGLSATDPIAELRRALEEVLDFTAEDLPENHAGRLSSRQLAAQGWALARTAGVLAAFLIPFLVVFGGVFPYIFIGQDFLAGEPVALEQWIPALCAPAFMLLILLLAVGSYLNRFRDLLKGEVQAVDGEVQERTIVTGSGRSRRTNYYYEINGQRFQVTAAALQALVSGRRYRLHYFPRSKHVVSVEPL
ncbi:MAG: hypothetical protein KA764_00020 [Anaerolineales bacterium]|nr:hypothetical protein [Anaerolineales bacterium]